MEIKYTEEQLKAAYALNLCTVSVSQIIDYADINIMEQEYEGILNNLNLEQIPKDEALLNILKQILDTITFFRIEEGDKRFIEKDYQQKMKNAIWSAVPNVSVILTGDPIGIALSLAQQIGTGYMNYRKAKAQAKDEKEKDMWELERTAIEQFNGLRRELFDTAWRLSANHNFPDDLRLTERQIKQYNSILMDNDPIRKYARLDAIKDEFEAYPPFWYYFGNTANEIARSALKINDDVRSTYRNYAKEHYMKFRTSNQQGLLREDTVAAACALELVDLLDFSSDADLIKQLLSEAIKYSGRANDIMQLAAMSYIKIKDYNSAAYYLNQLVNEQYNTTMNAQLLSSIYAKLYLETFASEIKVKYEILSNQVGSSYLYPLPSGNFDSPEKLETEFTQEQKQNLLKKYQNTIKYFIEKYEIRFNKIIPMPDRDVQYSDSFFNGSEGALDRRKYEIKKIYQNKRKTEAYIDMLKDTDLLSDIIDLLNNMFDACCKFDFINNMKKNSLALDIKIAISIKKKELNDFIKKLNEDDIKFFDIEKLLELSLKDFTEDFFNNLNKEIVEYISSRNEMQDFSIAEQNLNDFCRTERLPEPITENETVNTVSYIDEPEKKQFTLALITGEEKTEKDPTENTNKIISLIKDSIPGIIGKSGENEMFVSGDPRIERYFTENERLKADNNLMKDTLAILDNKSKKVDFDLIFTVYGIVPVKKDNIKKTVPYKDIDFIEGKENYLTIDGHFTGEDIDIAKLSSLIFSLREYSSELPKTSSFTFPEIKLPFGKK